LSGNRWGLRGSEDLGNGTSAIFRIESGFDITNGESGQDGRLFGRQAIIGLSNDQWGTVTLGRQFNPGDDYVSILDPFQDDGGYLTAARNTFGDSLSDWYDNSFKYMSPDWNGFSFGLGAVIEDNKKKSNGITTSTNRTS